VFFFSFYILRRFVIILLLTLNEGDVYWTFISFLLTTEFQLMFLLSERPFYEPGRNRMEIFNEAVILILVIPTLCFTEVMDAFAHESIGWYIISIVICYLIVHLISLTSDSISKLGQLIWKQLSKFKQGRKIQTRIKKRTKTIRKFLRRKTTFLRSTREATVSEASVESSLEAPSSVIDTPSSSMSMGEIEEILRNYR